MNFKRLVLAVLAVFIVTFVTDFLIHGLWLEGAYTRSIDLWRSDPEILLNFPWTVGAQLLASILLAAVWAIGFANGAGFLRACVYGLFVGLLRQTDTLMDYAVQPIPSRIALSWFASGMAQSMLLAWVTFITYKPLPATGQYQRNFNEPRWLAGALLVTCLIGGVLVHKSQTPETLFEVASYVTPPTTAPQPTPSTNNFNNLLFSVDSKDGQGNPESKARLLEELAKLNAQIRERNMVYDPQIKPLLDTLVQRQLKGKNVAYSLQIYREIRWWLNFTSDTNTLQTRIDELSNSLESGRSQSFAEEQQPDGSWGPGYTQWFMKVYGTMHSGLSVKAKQKYPLTFLDRINSPEKLTNYLHSVVFNDFLKTGVLNRMETDETVSILGRLILGETECDYAFHPQLKEAYLKFLDDWQNPQTGCWGNLLVAPDGTVWRMDDVGMTFHIVANLEGRTKHLDKIGRRVLELSIYDFPVGIRMNGRYENHINWDAVIIWRQAWPHMDAATKQDVRVEISQMLKWSLTESLKPDGSFRLSELDNTFGDAMGFGIHFLRDVGYFNKSSRFWTDGEFREAREVYERIKRRLEAAGTESPELERAHRRMSRIQPD